MEDCRVARLRALAVARPSEAARLHEEVDAALAAPLRVGLPVVLECLLVVLHARFKVLLALSG
jgi:hypothetical protein